MVNLIIRMYVHMLGWGVIAIWPDSEEVTASALSSHILARASLPSWPIRGGCRSASPPICTDMDSVLYTTLSSHCVRKGAIDI